MNQQQVEEFIANLLSMGLRKDQLAEKGYEFAVALLQTEEREGAPISGTTMFRATELVKNALPGAYRIYERRNMMR